MSILLSLSALVVFVGQSFSSLLVPPRQLHECCVIAQRPWHAAGRQRRPPTQRAWCRSPICWPAPRRRRPACCRCCCWLLALRWAIHLPPPPASPVVHELVKLGRTQSASLMPRGPRAHPAGPPCCGPPCGAPPQRRGGGARPCPLPPRRRRRRCRLCRRRWAPSSSPHNHAPTPSSPPSSTESPSPLPSSSSSASSSSSSPSSSSSSFMQSK